MKFDTVIIFDKIPKEFRRHESVSVMQYELSGIQSFIFGEVTLASTQENITARSEYIIQTTDMMEVKNG